MQNQNRSKGYKPKFNSKPRKPKQKDDCKKEEPYGRDAKMNDWSWYAKNESLLKDTASYSFNNPLGVPLSVGSIVDNNYKADAIPGIMTIQIGMTPGLANSAESPANLAAQNVYSFVRYMNSGAKNYDPADLMLYLLQMDSLYAQWNNLKRVYGVLRVYSQRNYYMARAMVGALGFNFDDMVTHIADLRAYLNASAARISSYCVPAVMPLFIRHSWMFTNLFKDSDNYKAQTYAFTPAYFYRYDETGSQFGGRLVAFKPTVDATFAQAQAQLDGALGAVAYSEDIGVMSGDILKAYGEANLWKLSAVEEDYCVEPVYREEVLNQIHNLNITPFAFTTIDRYNITQNPDQGWLIYDPYESIPEGQIIVSKPGTMMNMPWDTITPENVIVGTRLTNSYNIEDGNWRFNSMGTEIVGGLIVWYYDADGVLRAIGYPNQFIPSNVGADFLARYFNFDWAPMLYLVDPTTNKVVNVFGDITNYTIFTDTDITKLHTTAVLSEFNVPQLGSF